MTYPVVETFYSVQGEGAFAGASAFFIRLAGCPVKCPWCDTKESWKAESKLNLSAGELAAAASLTNCDFAVITGGEPTIHPLFELVDELKAQGVKTHLETSGYMDKNLDFDWITLSPKLHSHTSSSYLEAADELKFIVSSERDIERYLETFADFIPSKKYVFITPEASKMGDESLLGAIVETVKSRGAPFRVGLQIHKFLKVR